MTTAGQFSFDAVPNSTSGLTTSDPQCIVAGFNNDLWLTDPGNHAVGRITTSGTVTESSQGLTSTDVPTGITRGPDGNDWFTDPSDRSRDPIGQPTSRR